MKKNGIIWIVIIWVVLTLISYYYMPFFLLAFGWLGLSLALLLLIGFQLITLFKERKHIKRISVIKLFTLTIIFLLTFFQRTTHLAIEKMDWLLWENRRSEIVAQVSANKLNPNVSWNEWVCELPFEFPVVSNGGNDIGIFRNKENRGITVTFWVFRNFFDAPSTHFIFTDDREEIKQIEAQIKDRPEENWKIKENWYRTYGE
jgi:hypothetical protein